MNKSIQYYYKLNIIPRNLRNVSLIQKWNINRIFILNPPGIYKTGEYTLIESLKEIYHVVRMLEIKKKKKYINKHQPNNYTCKVLKKYINKYIHTCLPNIYSKYQELNKKPNLKNKRQERVGLSYVFLVNKLTNIVLLRIVVIYLIKVHQIYYKKKIYYKKIHVLYLAIRDVCLGGIQGHDVSDYLLNLMFICRTSGYYVKKKHINFYEKKYNLKYQYMTIYSVVLYYEYQIQINHYLGKNTRRVGYYNDDCHDTLCNRWKHKYKQSILTDFVKPTKFNLPEKKIYKLIFNWINL